MIITIISVLILLILVFAAVKPDSIHIERTAYVRASQEKVFTNINDFHHWDAWSPWEHLDPTMKKTYEGASSGVGARYTWEGNRKVEAGSMEIIESAFPTQIRIKLDFIRPFEGHNTAEFNLETREEGVGVTWIMQGPNPFFTKLTSIFYNMDNMIGRDMERGLTSLKSVTEANERISKNY